MYTRTLPAMMAALLAMMTFFGCSAEEDGRECLFNTDCPTGSLCEGGSCQVRDDINNDVNNANNDVPDAGEDIEEDVTPPQDVEMDIEPDIPDGEDIREDEQDDTGDDVGDNVGDDADADVVDDDVCVPSDEVCDGLDNDCDDEVDELAEIDLNACEPRDGATPAACLDGACVYSCLDEFRDRNGDLNDPNGDGCEFACQNEEICNDLDDDCDGEVDEGCDNDGDDFCDANIQVEGNPAACPLGGGDCDDEVAEINPGVVEVCDDIDNNCDNETDEGCDDDGDGFCDINIQVTGNPEVCPNGVGDCNDDVSAINPSSIETCDDIDNNCTEGIDEGCDDDNDGFCDIALIVVGNPAVCANGTDDCDDNEPNTFPGNTEICDDIDNNCVMGIDEDCDDDNDEFCDANIQVIGTPAVCPNGSGDCNDEVPTVNPGALEACDDIDNNCIAGTDEGCDDDNDDYCDANIPTIGNPTVCPQGGGDCDDDEPNAFPGNAEICDDVNNNCVAGIDEGCDDDNDNYCDANIRVINSPSTCTFGGGDCDDENPDINFGQEEFCDDIDNNCLEGIDESCNFDNDGFCHPARTVIGNPAVCPQGGGDCNDFRDTVYPGAPEICDGQDNDCNEDIDTADSGYEDFCALQNGVCAGSLRACNDGVPEDCTPERYAQENENYLDVPGFGEINCDGLDNDCDGNADEHICQTVCENQLDQNLMRLPNTQGRIQDMAAASSDDGILTAVAWLTRRSNNATALHAAVYNNVTLTPNYIRTNLDGDINDVNEHISPPALAWDEEEQEFRLFYAANEVNRTDLRFIRMEATNISNPIRLHTLDANEQLEVGPMVAQIQGDKDALAFTFKNGNATSDVWVCFDEIGNAPSFRCEEINLLTATIRDNYDTAPYEGHLSMVFAGPNHVVVAAEQDDLNGTTRVGQVNLALNRDNITNHTPIRVFPQPRYMELYNPNPNSNQTVIIGRTIEEDFSNFFNTEINSLHEITRTAISTNILSDTKDEGEASINLLFNDTFLHHAMIGSPDGDHLNLLVTTGDGRLLVLNGDDDIDTGIIDMDQVPRSLAAPDEVGQFVTTIFVRARDSAANYVIPVFLNRDGQRVCPD